MVRDLILVDINLEGNRDYFSNNIICKVNGGNKVYFFTTIGLATNNLRMLIMKLLVQLEPHSVA